MRRFPEFTAHIFVTARSALVERPATLTPLLAPGDFLWVSWFKKAAWIPTDITDNVVRDVAPPMGLVDVKVCAIDAIWSALKLVMRKTG